ncbi:hypothetical protein RCOM_1216960 [Ricinus communis]|uniref:Uncharacterized protein n=1 Tax=Ricinus communis TaxID=3988 RepID=B9SQS0_RICCO|nr:hypothetical protein RCOM_1216960 [Ricinus communis]
MFLQTDDLEGRVRAHRSKEGMHNASFLYFIVQGKSIACQLETLLINQLPCKGFQLTNMADVASLAGDAGHPPGRGDVSLDKLRFKWNEL